MSTSSKKFLLGSALLFALLFVLIFLLVFVGKKSKESISRVCFEDECFFVEIARTQEERTRGLMFRSELPEDRGMLFIFKGEGIHSFWMKNTYIPLDIIWISAEKEVVFINKNTPPCGEECPSIIPDKSALYVLEINAGMADKIGLKTGSILDFTL